MAGGGVEFALTQNWSAKAEYNFIDFGNDQVLRGSVPPLLPPGIIVDSDSDNQMHAIKVGVNYRFTGLPGR
jgi:outer membrane immunogenic protein